MSTGKRATATVLDRSVGGGPCCCCCWISSLPRSLVSNCEEERTIELEFEAMEDRFRLVVVDSPVVGEGPSRRGAKGVRLRPAAVLVVASELDAEKEEDVEA